MSMKDETWRGFRVEGEGTFLDRPNRFVLRVTTPGGVVAAHCPNPGRLTELLFPGSRILLEKGPPDRKLAYTAVAVGHPHTGHVVPLASVRCNPAVGALVLPRWFPGATIRPEFALEGSRFDFLVEAGDERHLIEVKACSDVEYGSALFPDAPSDRARKHLEELARWSRRGYRSHVLFAVVHGDPTHFSPNVHTDPAFARTLIALAPQLNLHAVLFQTGPGGLTRLVNDQLPVVLADPGPDSGTLVRVTQDEGRWHVAVDWHASGFERAVAKAPARTSFALRSADPWHRPGESEFREGDGSWEFPQDPRTLTSFVDKIMEGRHRPRP